MAINDMNSATQRRDVELNKWTALLVDGMSSSKKSKSSPSFLSLSCE